MKLALPLLLVALLVGCSARSDEPRPAFVVIGDSIAEGHPALHGPLHLGGPPQPGQLAYELSPTAPAANMGYGGETSDQLRKRWKRDTRGAKRIYLHTGANDLAQDRPNLRRNLAWFAEDARRRGVELWLANIGPDLEAWTTPEKVAEAEAVNRWLATDFQRQFPEVVLIDYAGWGSEWTGNLRHLRPGAYADKAHPSPEGYRLYAQEVLREVSVRRAARP